MSTSSAFLPTLAHHLHNSQPKSTASASRELLIPQGSVTASLQFYTPPEDGSKPFNYAGPWADNPPNGLSRNFASEYHDVTISDLRGQESSFNLDDNAFAALKNVSSSMKYNDWESDETIEKVYYPEVKQLLLDSLPGSSRIYLFDHTIRRPSTNRQPVSRVHIDQTAKSTQARVKHHLPEEADELLKGRYRIVNVWRPLNGPVYASPLAMADSATVQDEDLVGVEHRYPDRTGETAAVRFHESQHWYYWSGMVDDERLFLKCYDSDETVGPHGRVPHTAFVDPRTPEGAPERESIEVRALVFG